MIRWGLIAVFGVLLLSLPAYTSIPWGPFWGLDLHNLYVFHHCQAANNPYLATGLECGDVQARGMLYPPFLYWSFYWLRFVSFETAIRLWSFSLVLALAVSYWAWVSSLSDGALGTVGRISFWTLLCLQVPTLLGIERGGTDAIVLLLWSLAALNLVKDRIRTAGALAGLSVAYKLYPIFSCLIIIVGMGVNSRRSDRARSMLSRFSTGAAAGFLFPNLLSLRESTLYYLRQLPDIARMASPINYVSHPLPALNYALPYLGSALSLGLLIAWSATSVQSIMTDPALVLSGALAISTYFSTISIDYNLVTSYPLLLVLFERARNNTRMIWVAIGLLGIIGNRYLFMSLPMALLRMALLVGWLYGTGLPYPKCRTYLVEHPNNT